MVFMFFGKKTKNPTKYYYIVAFTNLNFFLKRRIIVYLLGSQFNTFFLKLGGGNYLARYVLYELLD
ncbi:MAG: Unknown protein [uncultured Aureispira sp.]|uniref:Uncharacterized protein n=1 Tax=uncultured Aureispira sp. TaxID=1331704 RepID=A0A6S6UAM3_9BACT|nr:MAG: Unknown protein [uncultured Aureispira sp.]